MPAYIDEDEVIPWLRAMGVPNEITDGSLTYLLSSALSRYSRIRPWLYLGSLSVVGGTQSYDIPTTITIEDVDYKVIDVAEFIYSPRGLDSMPNLYGLPPNWWKLGAGEFYVFDQPSLGYIWFADFKHLNDVFQGNWDLYEDYSGKTKIRLMPVPTQAFVYPILYRLMRTLATIREDDRHIFHLIVMIEVCRYFANSAGMAHEFSDSGMSVNTNGGASHYREMMMDYEYQLINLTGNFAVARSG